MPEANDFSSSRTNAAAASGSHPGFRIDLRAPGEPPPAVAPQRKSDEAERSSRGAAPARASADAKSTQHKQPIFHPAEPFTVSEFGVLALLIACFVFTMSAVISPDIVPLNGDEVDTAWRFLYQHWYAKSKPWDLGASHSGMYDFVFWLRALPFGEMTPGVIPGNWFFHHPDVWCRWFTLGTTAILLAVVYLFARWMLGKSYGFLATALVAFQHYNMFMSVEGNYLHETSVMYLLTAWAFLAGERSEHWWKRLLWGLLAGLGAVLCWMMYFSGRLITLGFLALIVLRFIEDRRWIHTRWILIVAFFAVLLPSLVKFRRDLEARPDLTSYRQTATQLLYRPQVNWALNDYGTDSVILMTAKNVLASFTVYHHGTNNYHGYQRPGGFLDRFSLLLCLIGLLFMIWKWRWPPFFLIMLFFLYNNAILSGLTMLPYPPYHQRVHVGILLTAFAAAIPLWFFARLPRTWGRLGGVFAVSCLLFIVFTNTRLYFDRAWNRDEALFDDFGRAQEIGNFMNPMNSQYEFVVYNWSGKYWSFDSQVAHMNPTFRIPDFRIWTLDQFRGRTWAPDIPKRRLCFLIEDPSSDAIFDEINRRLPGGRWIREEWKGKPFYRIYLPPRPRTEGSPYKLTANGSTEAVPLTAKDVPISALPMILPSNGVLPTPTPAPAPPPQQAINLAPSAAAVPLPQDGPPAPPPVSPTATPAPSGS